MTRFESSDKGVGSSDDEAESTGIIERVSRELYDVFGQYGAPAMPNLSPVLSVSLADAEALYRRPLREVTSEELWSYALHALNTWGGIEDFKHFLPRLFELLWTEPGWAMTEQLIGKFDLARWRTWPREEQQAVESFLDAFLKLQLAVFPGEIFIGEVVAGIAQARGSLAEQLASWQENPARSATLHIAGLIEEERDNLWKNALVGRRFLHARQELTDWLRSETIARRLDDDFFANPDAPHADRVAGASDILAGIPS